MSKEYRQLMQRYAQESPGNPFSEEEIDRVTSQPRRPDGSGVPLKRWPMVACMALLVSVGAGMLWPREEEGILVAEVKPTPLEIDTPSEHQKTPKTIVPRVQTPVREVAHAEDLPVIATPLTTPAPEPLSPEPDPIHSPLTTDHSPLNSHPAEHIICYHDGQPVECEDEQTINIIMSFLS